MLGALCATGLACSRSTPAFRVVALYTAKEDPAHISFVREAQAWFPKMATQYHFSFDTTSDHDSPESKVDLSVTT